MNPNDPYVAVHRTPMAKRSREFALVLRAADIPFVDGREGREYVLLVATDDELRAVDEFRQYEVENVGWPPKHAPLLLVSSGLGAVAAWILVLWTAFLFQQSNPWDTNWTQIGVSHAARVLDGELWRSVTALTLHSDWNHLLSNVIFGSLFLVLVAQLVGNGAALLAALLSGALGNLLNAWIQRPEHSSLGASTAVFGLIGVLAAHQFMRRRDTHRGRLYRWAPLLIGAVFLGYMGVGDERTDVLAHCTGLLFGGVLGAFLGRFEPRTLAPRRLQLLLGTLAFALLLGAWITARLAAA